MNANLIKHNQRRADLSGRPNDDAVLLGSLDRKATPIYVWLPVYNSLSGGNRALHLLTYKLRQLGYDVYAIDPPNTLLSGARRFVRAIKHLVRQPKPQPIDKPPYEISFLDNKTRISHADNGMTRIAVYPEIIAGNPLNAEIVVRYLLNKSNLLVPGVESTFGTDDIFLAFDPNHLPAGKSGFDLFIPLVDRNLYYPPAGPVARRGTIAFTYRQSRLDVTSLPSWLSPVTEISMAAPRPPSELAELYRTAMCMIISERSTAIYEALCCGCPVICLSSGSFQESTYQRRFKSAGLAWELTSEALAQAAAGIPSFITLYDHLEESLDLRIQRAFDKILQLALNRRTPSRPRGQRGAIV